MLFTPGQFTRRADFYHQLGQMNAAGLGVMVSLQHIRRTSPSRVFTTRIGAALADMESGLTVAESFSRQEGWLPEFDVALLHAGERSGRLDETFKTLSDFYQNRAAIARKIFSAMAYPVFLIHAALFILRFPHLFMTGDVVGYFTSIFSFLLPIYALFAVGIYLCQGRRGETWRGVIERITFRIPFVGSGRRELALARLSTALEALITAGETIHEAWPLAAAASGSPALCREVESWRAEFSRGRTPADALQSSRVFPEMFTNLYSTGEISGSLDETLGRLSRYYAEEGSRHLHTAARIGPGIAYALVAAYIAWQVISFYVGRNNQLNEVMSN